MGKIKLKGMKKGRLRNSFNFEKSWEVVGAIDRMVGKLGLNEAPNHKLKDLIYSGKEFGPKFKIEEIVDELHSIKNADYSADVFIGEAKIFLVVNSFVDRQKEVVKAVFEFADFEEEAK